MNEGQWLKSEDPLAMLAFLNEGSRRLLGRTVQYQVSDRKLRLYGFGLYLAFLAMKKDKPYYAKVDYAWIDGEGPPPPRWNLTEMAPTLFAERSVECYTLHGKDAKYEYVMVSAKDACDLMKDVVGNPFRPQSPVRQWSLGECKVCGNRPDDEGELEHGKGCYTQGEDGGGSEFADEIVEPWLTPQVVMLANDAYENRLTGGELDPVTLLALADALEESGYAQVDRDFWLGELDGCFCDDYGRPECDGCKKARAELHRPDLIAALRSPGKKWRGFWVVDTLLNLR